MNAGITGERMRVHFNEPIGDVTYRHAPDLHPVSVANHKAEGRVRCTAVHL